MPRRENVGGNYTIKENNKFFENVANFRYLRLTITITITITTACTKILKAD
jgi:hypothetical protein